MGHPTIDIQPLGSLPRPSGGGRSAIVDGALLANPNRRSLTGAATGLGLLLACGTSQPPASQLTAAQLLDPTTCQTCHPTQFSDWQGSMHAYASEDPVFLAMNQRGQRETDGGLGTFCIQCHAPMASVTGASTNGLNIASLPAPLRGVTCFFCHSVAEVDGTHNDPLILSFDGGLRGSIKPPEPALIPSMPHGGVYSPFLDSSSSASATMCGACHDIVNGHGTPIERTFVEWQASAFSGPDGETCNQCHLLPSITPLPISTLPGSPNRELHDHLFPAVDIALTPFPNAATEQQEVQSFLASSLQSALCVEPTGTGALITVILENVSAGHSIPSGAAQDRRLWVQIVATDADGGILYSSGAVDAGASPITDAANDPDRWLLRDCMFDDAGTQVDMFWQAASFEGNELPGSQTFDKLNLLFYQSHLMQTFPRNGVPLLQVPAQVTLQVYLQPVGLDVLEDLVASGDLDAGVVQAMPTFVITPPNLPAGTPLVWTPAIWADAGLLHPATSNLGTGPGTMLNAQCVTATAVNVGADVVDAVDHVHCFP